MASGYEDALQLIERITGECLKARGTVICGSIYYVDDSFKILSILGIVLLILLGIALVVILLVLFFPISYKAAGKRTAENSGSPRE